MDKERILHVKKSFADNFPQTFSDVVKIFSAPGRLELIGNHTDHQGGAVLTGTVDADILACAAINATEDIEVISEGYGSLSLSSKETDMVPEEKNTTVSIIRGMVKAVSDKGFQVHGFNVYAASQLPSGLGMSSSAAFEMLIGLILNEFFCDGKLSNEDIAYAGMYAEREYFGKPCGLMDQMACITGGINLFDFSDSEKPDITPIDFDFESAGFDIIVTDTGGSHADMADEFNAIPNEMYSVANALGAKRLCEVSEDDFYGKLPFLRRKAGDRAIMRAMHWYDEVKRVRINGESLKKGDTDTFLDVINASGRSSFMYLQNVDDYKDTKHQSVALSLALAAHVLDGDGAVRIQGGGFAGSIIAFVPKPKSEDFIEKMEKLFGKGRCRRVSIRKKGATCLK